MIAYGRRSSHTRGTKNGNHIEAELVLNTYVLMDKRNTFSKKLGCRTSEVNTSKGDDFVSDV
jgi:hypothetical protein